MYVFFLVTGYEEEFIEGKKYRIEYILVKSNSKEETKSKF